MKRKKENNKVQHYKVNKKITVYSQIQEKFK